MIVPKQEIKIVSWAPNNIILRFYSRNEGGRDSPIIVDGLKVTRLVHLMEARSSFIASTSVIVSVHTWPINWIVEPRVLLHFHYLLRYDKSMTAFRHNRNLIFLRNGFHILFNRDWNHIFLSFTDLFACKSRFKTDVVEGSNRNILFVFKRALIQCLMPWIIKLLDGWSRPVRAVVLAISGDIHSVVHF